MITHDQIQPYGYYFMIASPCTECNCSGRDSNRVHHHFENKHSYFECQKCLGTCRHERHLSLNELHNALAPHITIYESKPAEVDSTNANRNH